VFFSLNSSPFVLFFFHPLKVPRTFRWAKCINASTTHQLPETCTGVFCTLSVSCLPLSTPPKAYICRMAESTVYFNVNDAQSRLKTMVSQFPSFYHIWFTIVDPTPEHFWCTGHPVGAGNCT
jgi:hypothetical protein